MNLKDIFDIVVYAILAIFGVTAKEVKDAKKIEIANLISSIIVAAFGATMFYFVAVITNIPTQAGYIAAGLVGWGGSQAVEKLLNKYSSIYTPNGKDNDNEK